MQSQDMATITNELSTGSAQSGGIPLSMMQAGMCAGEVIGIAEMLKASDQPPRACIPKEVTKEQLVRVVAASVEKDPANMHEDFGTLAAAAMPGLSDWPNRRKLSRGAEPVRACRTEAIGQENPVSCKGDLP